MSLSNELPVTLTIQEKTSNTDFSNTTSSFFVNNYQYIYQMAFSILQDEFLSKDVAYESFLRLKKNKFLYDRVLSKRAWVLQITRDISYAILEKRKDAIPEIQKSNQATPIQEISATSDFFKILSNVSTLEKDILFLHIYCNLTFKEIAIMVNQSKTEVQRQYTKALDTLTVFNQKNSHSDLSYSPVVIVTSLKSPLETLLLKASSKLSSPLIDYNTYQTYCSYSLLEEFRDDSLTLSNYFKRRSERRVQTIIRSFFLTFLLVFLLLLLQINLTTNPFYRDSSSNPIVRSITKQLTVETIIAR